MIDRITEQLAFDRAVARFRFRQVSHRDYTIFPSGRDNWTGDEAVRTLIGSLKKILGDDVRIEIKNQSQFPLLPSGKRKLIVND